MAEPLVETWDVTCRLCGHCSAQTAEQLKDGNAAVAAKLLNGEDDVRPQDVTDYFMVPCASCGKLTTFEPMSPFRARKVTALDAKVRKLESLYHPDAPRQTAVLLARAAGTVLRDSARTPQPIAVIRHVGALLIRRLEQGIERLDPSSVAPGNEAVAIVREMVTIITEEAPERTALPKAPALKQSGSANPSDKPAPAPTKPTAPTPSGTGSWADILGGCLIGLVLLGLVGWGGYHAFLWVRDKVTDAFKEDCERKLEGPKEVAALAFSRDGKRIAAAGDHELFVWDKSTGNLVRETRWDAGRIKRIAFSDDSCFLYAGQDFGDHLSLEINSGIMKTGLRIPALNSPQGDGARSPDGTLEVAIKVTQLRIVPVANPAQQRNVRSFTGTINAALFSPDGSKLLVNADDKLFLFGVASAQMEREWKAKGTVSKLAFLPDGKRFVSAEGSTVHLWNMAASEPVMRMGHFLRDITVLEVSPDGQYLLTATTYASIRLWKLPE